MGLNPSGVPAFIIYATVLDILLSKLGSGFFEGLFGSLGLLNQDFVHDGMFDRIDDCRIFATDIGGIKTVFDLE